MVLALESKDLYQDPGTRRRLCLFHDMLNVLFDGLFGHAQLIGDFLVRPAL